MKITNEFTVHTPIDHAWTVLTDLAGIAPCMPGAQLTGVDGDTYAGRVKVKVGPVISDFAGTARFVEKDDTTRRAVIDARGRDARSAGNASAVVTAQLHPAGDDTVVSVDTDLKVSGKLAQFGSGMIKEISGKILTQFVTNLEAKLAEPSTSEPSASGVGSGALSSGVSGSGVSGSDASGPVASGSDVSGSDVSGSDVSGSVASGSVASGGAADATGAVPVLAPVPADEDATSSAVPTTTAPESSAAAASATPAAQLRSAAPTVAAAASLESLAPAAGAIVDPSAAPSVHAASSSDAGPSGTLPDQAAKSPEPEALDLMGFAGRSVVKRIVPAVVAVAAVVGVVVWLVARK
ncbi:SRPBCC family protein [Winogradskya humida]|uniref:Carbon monoxide dehydrogenase subunit G n=1 Tax=Winogradskya humida TaxID=113566 RepID=A0ABQ3ZV57_9ACTN|nr:SRPBCC family protein [Actinoplanes humidus]GIE22487.1 hypothetical protein Ahu01nite_055890 [Actinoplanes humidus]